MKQLLTISLMLHLLTSCTETEKKQSIDYEKQNIERQKTSIIKKEDTTLFVENLPNYSDPYDSLRKLVFDTTTLEGHRAHILNQFYLDYNPSSPDFDTLIDLNFDNELDYMIGYYGMAGTGIKNRILVYLFSEDKSYVYDSTLSNIANPTFYLNNKEITGFYMGNGGGGGSKIQWINGKWITTKEFNVDNQGDSTEWIITYPLKNKTELIKHHYQMTPPDKILKTDNNF